MASQSLRSKMKILLSKLVGREEHIVGDRIAVKVHFGSDLGHRYVRPVFVRTVVDFLRDNGFRPFVAETSRMHYPDALRYLEIARANGFTWETLNAPIILTDGILGQDHEIVAVKGFEISNVEVAAAIAQADALVVLSHIKGHKLTGMAGAIKNVGMGCLSVQGKRRIHEVTKPLIDVNKCVKCGLCLKVCPNNAIIQHKKTNQVCIVESNCSGCCSCLICPFGAFDVPQRNLERFQIRLSDAVKAVHSLHKEGVFYVSFLMDITSTCDCANSSPVPLIPDIGILASHDIVAIEQASLDLISDKGTSIDKWFALNKVSPEIQIQTCEKHGLGRRDYELEII